MKKMIALILVLVILAVTFVGCAQEEEIDEGEATRQLPAMII